jgi:hypothetical protein
MFLLFMVIGLVFLISGGVGLFVVNINMAVGSHTWIIGNITFSTFTVIGALVLLFMAIFNSEFE